MALSLGSVGEQARTLFQQFVHMNTLYEVLAMSSIGEDGTQERETKVHGEGPW
jgi:hypothetical protein